MRGSRPQPYSDWWFWCRRGLTERAKCLNLRRPGCSAIASATCSRWQLSRAKPHRRGQGATNHRAGRHRYGSKQVSLLRRTRRPIRGARRSSMRSAATRRSECQSRRRAERPNEVAGRQTERPTFPSRSQRHPRRRQLPAAPGATSVRNEQEGSAQTPRSERSGDGPRPMPTADHRGLSRIRASWFVRG